MPLYDCRHPFPTERNTLGTPPLPGSVPFPRFDGRPGRLYDAAGALVQFPLWCNTETGEVCRYDGRDGKWQTDPTTGRVALITETRPAPLEYREPPAEEKAKWTGASSQTVEIPKGQPIRIVLPPLEMAKVTTSGTWTYSSIGAATVTIPGYTITGASGTLKLSPAPNPPPEDGEADQPHIVGG